MQSAISTFNHSLATPTLGQTPHASPPLTPTSTHPLTPQDLGAKSMDDVRRLMREGALRMETRSAAAQNEGGVHDMLAYEKKPW